MLQSLAENAGGVLSAGGPGAVRPGPAVRFPAQSVPWLRPRAVLAAESASGNVGGMVMAAAILLLLGLAGVVAWRSDFASALSTGDSTVDTDTSAEPSTERPESTADAESAQPEQSTGAEADAETKSDQEIIVDILEDHEGRMKQANIVDETGWSKSKVSMLLSDMEEDGDISKLRVGRENIISLSGNEPEAAGSPFDEE